MTNKNDERYSTELKVTVIKEMLRLARKNVEKWSSEDNFFNCDGIILDEPSGTCRNIGSSRSE